ncbi:hypothetical protein LFAB_15880 [Lactiplantibacillus fabifermentans T30PCM01]|uniref:Uncharacterized protein n=2 Tax=Lactiplantibacillus fabifermentans TaxID=483011 RepID=W6TBJ4_9LACO|nr:hypothetical protein LFAB_15880 [Lactiplantibacillus fabifermentans T30PCM01]
MKRVGRLLLSGPSCDGILLVIEAVVNLKGALTMEPRLVIVHEEGRYRELSEKRYWLESANFWGVDGRGDTVNEAIGNFLTNLVQYCHDYYDRDLWQLDNRLLQLDHVDAVLAYANVGKSPAPLFLFKVLPALASA